MRTQKISMTDRLIAGFLFAFFVGITAICVPIGLVMLTRGKAVQLLVLFKGFSVWESGILATAAVLGIVLGIDRSAELLGHLWGTEEPRRTELTVGLWVFFIAIASLSYWIAGKRHGI